VSGLSGRAAGIVKTTITGAPEDLAAMIEILSGYGVEIIEQSTPGPGRRELTVLIQARAEMSCLQHEHEHLVAAVEAGDRAAAAYWRGEPATLADVIELRAGQR
jgi:hypothetical protein